MNTYNENESNRKQAMIPLIALLICFLAITGVGVAYAYNHSTIQIDENPVNEQYFTLDYTNQSGNMIYSVLEIPTDSKDMTVTTSIVANGVNPRTFNAVINEDGTDSFERVFYVKLASNMDAGQMFEITGTVTGDTVTNAIFGDCTFKFYKGTGFTEEVTAGQFTASEVGVVYKVVLTVPIKTNVDVKTIPGLAGASAIADATTLATALDNLTNHTFTVNMEARLVTATP